MFLCLLTIIVTLLNSTVFVLHHILYYIILSVLDTLYCISIILPWRHCDCIIVHPFGFYYILSQQLYLCVLCRSSVNKRRDLFVGWGSQGQKWISQTCILSEEYSEHTHIRSTRSESTALKSPGINTFGSCVKLRNTCTFQHEYDLNSEWVHLEVNVFISWWLNLDVTCKQTPSMS